MDEQVFPAIDKMSGLETADHIEMDHERELSAVSFSQVRRTHWQMHQQRDDWGHTHA